MTTEKNLVVVKVSRSALLQNLRAHYALAPEWEVIPVLKSNAYGHGLALVAHILENEERIPFFALDSSFEAEMVRGAGVMKPLLIMGYTPISDVIASRLPDVSFSVHTLDDLEALARASASAAVQIKFDTGLHRLGIPHEDADRVAALLSGAPKLTVTGIFSHLAEAEVPDSPLTAKQIERWNTLAKRFQKEFPNIHSYHLANSAGFGHADRIVANAGRTGFALYGLNPGNLTAALTPILSMETIITAVRTIEPGETVGYNATFTAVRPTRVATVPVGYYEGVDRRLSGKGTFLVEGKLAPILGRVSMNISSCDVTDIPSATVGTPVTVMSAHASDPNSVANIARLCGTIPWDIMVRIAPHLKRTVEP